MNLEVIKSLFVDLGFTLDKIFPLVVLFVLLVSVFYKIFKPTKKKLDNVEAFILRLCGAIQTGGTLSQVDTYSNASPLKINEKGYQVLEQSKFKKGIEDNIDLLLKSVDKLSPKSAFDVEQLCMGLITYVISDKNLNVFKESEDYLYQNPQDNKPEMFNLAGLYLRDKYLEKHPELIPEVPQEPNKVKS